MKEDDSVTAKIGYLFPHNSQVLLCLECFSFLCLNEEFYQLSLLGAGVSPRRWVVTCPTHTCRRLGDEEQKRSSASNRPVTDSAVPRTGVSSQIPSHRLTVCCTLTSLSKSKHPFLQGLLTLASKSKVIICSLICAIM